MTRQNVFSFGSESLQFTKKIRVGRLPSRPKDLVGVGKGDVVVRELITPSSRTFRSKETQGFTGLQSTG